MKQLLRKLIRGMAYFAAAIVIVLAIAVGIFRLMLPRLPEYQEEIKSWASTAIGMNVEFSGMNARWRLSGPELSFFGAALSNDQTGASLLNAEEVSIGVGLLRLIADRELVVDRVSIRNTSIDLRQDEAGNWILQGIPVDEILGGRDMSAQAGGRIELVGEDLDVSYEHPASGQLIPFNVSSVTVTRDGRELGIESDIDLDPEFGDRLEISANRSANQDSADLWRMYVEADSIDLAGWSRLRQFALPEINAGAADIILWFDLDAGGIDNATANVVISDLQAVGEQAVSPIDIQGSFEYSVEPDGWLVGANQLRVNTVDGDWPQSSLQLRLQQSANGELEALRGTASYLNLDDLRYLMAWLPADRQATLAGLSLSGVMRDLSIELDGLQDEQPGFDVSADLEQAGFAPDDDRPGVREFSGRLRADRDGGRVEIESTNLRIDLRDQLPEPLVLDDAFGTVIWRRNAAGMIVLSDSIQIRNADFDSQMSLQVSIPADEAAPVVDFESSWSVFDVSAVSRYLPIKLITPKLYQWLSDALVSGYVRRGTTRFNGALDDFPDWPAPEFRHLDVVVENTRLYTEENSAINLGNLVEDAHVEIPDLRDPILSIETFATGTLQSIKDYADQSPISRVFGGQLDRVEVDGDASFDLTIELPIQNAQDYEFSTKIRASNGTIRVLGFPAPLTEMNGSVTITRDDISSESLFATFLGSPVNLSLSRVGDADSPHSVILEGNGQTTAEALQAELGIPFEGVVEGDMEYQATIRFPNGRAAQPGMLQIGVESDLYGLQVNLPAPIGKSDEVALPLSMNLEFPTPNQISTAGSLDGEVNWTARFLKEGEAWDFDRGVIAIGEYPRNAGVRGLHIHGQMSALYLHQWLAEGRRGNREAGLGDRIRSIDLGVDDLYAVGQKFTDHRIEVNRSGRDWLIQISGKEASGTVTVPFDFAGERPMTLDMERLVLPGNDSPETESEPVPLDPRVLPALSIRAAEFALGDRYFGELEADFDRTDRGLVASTLTTRDDSFTVTGTAGWVVDAYEEMGQRTYFNATLRSTNVQQTSQRLAYDPGIESDDMEIGLDIGWPGGPRRDFMSVLNGEVVVRFGAGRLAEVEPGAGRMFGLMSFTALPRRLSLDFSDVFDTGFGYDIISGDFRLVNGEAFTCNLTLTGPAADVGIVGRAGLETRDYDQAALVSPNVGGTLPVAGFFLGGPQVAAALLVFSQLFKKPLQDMGQVFYTVEGSWDEPGINTTDSQGFTDISDRAGCLTQP